CICGRFVAARHDASGIRESLHSKVDAEVRLPPLSHQKTGRSIKRGIMISMTSRPAWGGLFSLAVLAGAAYAQDPTERPAVDPLCGGLSTAITAADQQIPFIILVPANQ